ncbi:uncharacterized protein BDZ99DRAFT_447576 [Mytilinidion resinicola]|uniref:Rhodopsin domain-containing protein n=1 Tax=Mytilinidion resinicola TaxID=574789 RepID=A0A6A6YFE5_9PEZI|nr:uncharacterized protein BDZ99DRAFT_447576 [Mytilinidion resinicola]KAF2807253.1 hypothetical protein BDZ99DRAFT_447576 [Mytilinidion resinicola]
MAETRGPQLTAVMVVFLSLAWLTMMLRTYVRVRMLRSFGLDDWLAAVALVLFTVYSTFVFESIKHGVTRHVSDLKPSQVEQVIKDFYVNSIFFFSTTAMIKLSVSALLLRIAVKRYQRYIIYSQVVVTVLFTVVTTVLMVFSCRPIEYFWTRYNPLHTSKGTCVVEASGVTIILYVYVGHAVIADFTFAILPWYIIRGSSLTPRDKVSIIAVLGMGMLAGIAAAVRTPYVHRINTGADITFTVADVSIWGTIEPGLGLVAASTSTLRPIFRDFLANSRFFGSVTPPGQSGWQSSRRGYVHETANTHVLKVLSVRDKSGDVVVSSTKSAEDSGFSQSTNNRSIRNGSTRGLVVHEDSCGGSGDDVASEEEGPGAEWETGILKTTEFSVHREGTDVESAI